MKGQEEGLMWTEEDLRSALRTLERHTPSVDAVAKVLQVAAERDTRTVPGRTAVPGFSRRAGVPRSRRLLRWGLAGAALTAAAALAAIMLPSVLAGTPSAPAGRGRVPVTAAAVLLRAARAAAAAPDLHPRPGQFVFTESVSQYYNETGWNRRKITRAWLSADGWHGGLTLVRFPPSKKWLHGFPMPNCLTLPHSNWYYQANCPTPPAYVTNLPRTVKAMKRFLLGTGTAADAIIAITGYYQSLVPPRFSALMFRALAQVKGIRVIDHATTLAGRSGIAVAAYNPDIRSYGGGSLDELIFDPKTHLYIGDSEIAVHVRHTPKGTVYGNAVLRIAVVDKPGQLP